jgi:hypothetical protein
MKNHLCLTELMSPHAKLEVVLEEFRRVLGLLADVNHELYFLDEEA